MSPTPGAPSRSRALPPLLAATAVVVVLLLRAMSAAHGALLLYIPVAALAGVVLALASGSAAVPRRAPGKALAIGLVLAVVGLATLGADAAGGWAFPLWLLLAGGGVGVMTLAARALLRPAGSAGTDERESPQA